MEKKIILENAVMKRHFTRFVCPIRFSEATIKEVMSDENQFWKALDFFQELDDYVLPHILEYLCPDRTSKSREFLAFQWNKTRFLQKYDWIGKTALNFTTDFTTSLDTNKREIRSFTFKISRIEAYLFKSGIGFIVVETEIENCTFEIRERISTQVKSSLQYEHNGADLTISDLIHFNHALRVLEKNSVILYTTEFVSIKGSIKNDRSGCDEEKTIEAHLRKSIDCYQYHDYSEALAEIDRAIVLAEKLECADARLMKYLLGYRKELKKQFPDGEESNHIDQNDQHSTTLVSELCPMCCFRMKELRKPILELSPEDELLIPGIAFSDIIKAIIQSLPISNKTDFPEILAKKYLNGYTFASVTQVSDEPIDIDPEMFFHLRRFSRYSYRPSESDIKLENNFEILRTYDNITMGFCLEGGAVFTIEGQSRFFENFRSIVQKRYFLYYILALHQRHVLRVLANEIGDVPYCISEHDVTSEEMAEIKHLRFRIQNFILKNRFYQISDTTTHNNVYEKWCAILKIDSLLEELKTEVDELDELVKKEVLAKEQKTLNLLQIFISFMFPLSLLTGVFGMNVIEFQTLSLMDPMVIIGAVISLGIIVIMLFFVLGSRR